MKSSNTYQVIIETPLGDKSGETTLNIEDNGTVSGTLTMMGKTNTFENGTVGEDGSMSFGGLMHTPFGKMPYTLTGTLINGVIDAVSVSKIGSFKIKSK